jgi:hypothetical protein
MKDKLIISSVFASILAMSAFFAYSPQAQAHEGFRYRGGYYHGGCYGCNWVAPALIGGVIGYELSRPSTVVVEQPPVYVQQPSVVYVNPPGTLPPPAGYHYQYMIDPATNTQKIVLVPN